MKKNETATLTHPPKSRCRQRILCGVFTLMGIICIIIVISAFIDSIYSNHKIISLITKIDQLWNDNLPQDYEKISDSLIEKLEAVAKHSLESNTVTFLLTMLSAGVIAYALSLLDRSYKKMADIDEKIAKIESEKVPKAEDKLKELTQKAEDMAAFINTGVARWRTAAWLSKAKVMSALLKSQENEQTFDNMVPQLQDLLCFVYIDLQDTVQRTGPIESSQRRSFREETQNLKLDFESASDSYQQYVKALIDYCDKILELLKA